jgi:hypothetical protein
MSTQQEQLKSQIVAQVAVLVEQTLAQGEQKLTLTPMEELALKVRRQVEQAITLVWVQHQVSSAASDLPTCPQGGQHLHPKGKKKRVLRTRSGEIEMKHPYFDCKHCRRGSFPPG